MNKSLIKTLLNYAQAATEEKHNISLKKIKKITRPKISEVDHQKVREKRDRETRLFKI